MLAFRNLQHAHYNPGFYKYLLSRFIDTTTLMEHLPVKPHVP